MAKAKMIVLSVEDKPGTVADAIAALAEAKVNILSVFGWAPQGVLQLVVDNPRKATTALKKLGISCTEGKAEMIEMPNKPGTLHAFLTKLAKKGVNLRSLSGFGSKSGRKSFLVWTQS